ncbi:hypothetical protein GCM10025331_19290 [Actinoplanes utahensis]|nr:hypothetical protein Aut01nite_26500 [Actinoplanes utahensis]
MALAQTADDDAIVDVLLARITARAAEVVAGVDYASITAWRGAGYTTVATSDDLARAVDDAQHAEAAGPCVQAEQTATPVTVPDIAAMTMSWPGFHKEAARLGLQASVSVPLFAGGGGPVGVLNLYTRQAAELDTLSAGVRHVFAVERAPARDFAADGDAGTRQLLHGLGWALRLRVAIQQAVGMLMADTGCGAADGDRMLRDRAATARVSPAAAALRVIDEMEPGSGPGVRVTMVRLGGDVLWAAVSGELARPLDTAAAGQLTMVLDEPVSVVELDLSGLRFCDAAGLRLLLDLRERAIAAGRGLRLAAVSVAVRTLLSLTETAAEFGHPPASESAADGEPVD